MTDTATTDKALHFRNLIADHLEDVADLIDGSGFTPDQLGLNKAGTTEEIRAEAATYRRTGILP